MTRECDGCEGIGTSGPDICTRCRGEGEFLGEEWEVWNDTRGMLTHDGKVLCGNCVEGTTPDTMYSHRKVFKRDTRSWSIYRRIDV